MIQVDDSDFPLIRIRWPESWNNEELLAFFATMEGVGRRAIAVHTRYATVTSGSEHTTAEHRRMIAKWANSLPPEQTQSSAGSFVVVKSALGRGIVTALRWMVPSMKDVYAVDTWDKAETMARQALINAKALPPTAKAG